MSDAKNSSGRCVKLSHMFARLAIERLPLLPMAGGYGVYVTGAPPEDFGYEDRSIEGCYTHSVVVLISSSYQYMIDFTASQYGYSEHPMVQRRNGDGLWIRDW